MGPNVLLIVLDTARADAFEPYGAPAGASPTVAQLASSGGAVEHAYAPASWTVPSHASMFTGLQPRDIGLTQAPGGTPFGVHGVMESLADRSLPARLNAAGWRTAGASANGWIAENSGFATGFDVWYQFEPTRGAGRVHRIRGARRLATYAEGFLGRIDDGARAIEGVLTGWLAAVDPSAPFFWFVNLVECHSPYLPPRPYNDLPPLGRLRAAEEARRYLTFLGVLAASAGARTIPDDALERMRHLYARAVRSMDDWLARVLERLDHAGVLDDTIVVVTSDHGENLGEAGMIGHSLSLDQRLIRVPFVSSHPLAADDGHVLSLIDVPRLVADTVGLDDHPWGSEPVRRRLAVAQMDPMGGEGSPELLALARQLGLDDEGVRRLTWPATTATDGRYKLVRRGTEERFHDLVTDPLEVHASPPAGDEAAAAAAALRVAVDGALDPRPVPGWRGPSGTERAVSDEEVERMQRQLEVLGYL